METLRGHAGLIGWIIVTFGVVWALAWQHTISERQYQLAEQVELNALVRSYQLCETQNDIKSVIGQILDASAAPREDDEPGEAEARARFRASLQVYIEPETCPPPPVQLDRD